MDPGIPISAFALSKVAAGSPPFFLLGIATPYRFLALLSVRAGLR